mgnify:FL=1
MNLNWYSNYDPLIPQICPDYRIGLESIIKCISINPKKILELATGTGNLTIKLAKKFPKSMIESIDLDDEMLKIAKFKLKNHKNVNLKKENILESNIKNYDVVVSSLVFHMLPKQERKQLFDRIYKSKMKQLVVFDRMKGETEKEERDFEAGAYIYGY